MNKPLSKTRSCLAQFWNLIGKKHAFLFMLLFAIIHSAIAQQNVSGTVTDEDGEPIPGVNVIEKGTTNGTVTDIDGSYSITVPSSAILQFSFVGFRTIESQVNNNTVLNIELAAELEQLSEVVVVGYGEQRKETMTGSVVAIQGSEIARSPSANVSANLAGRLPGLTVNQRSGEPGRDDPNLLIRGVATFGNNAPLIIIDGVPRAEMARLNPEDIESVSVLKDASAAIYGARAANGVILITTKSGGKGKPEFNLSYNHAFQQPTILPEMLDAPTFAQVYNEGAWYRAGRPDLATWSAPFSQTAIDRYRDGSDPIRYPNTNWAQEAIKPYSIQRRVNLSARGGSENVNYFLSYGTVYQDGSLVNDPTEFQQHNMRVNVNVKLTDNLTLGANVSALLNNRTFGSVATNDEVWVNFHNIFQANPTIPAVYPNGLIGPGRLGENPLLMDQRGYLNRDDSPIFSTFTATYDVPFIDGLKLEASYNYDVNHQIERRWRTPYSFHEFNTQTGEYDEIQGTGVAAPELGQTNTKLTTQLYNFRINYSKTFDKHYMGLLLGTEQQKDFHNWVHAFRRNFVSSSIDQINAGSSDTDDMNTGGSTILGGYNNYFGRFNYDYDGKYLLEFLFRYDGSQRFPQGSRYGFFPGVSAGWRISEESFMDNIEFINHLKIRGSYGQIGNDLVAPFQHLQAFTFGGNYPFGGSVHPGVTPGVLPNPFITWEVSEKTDLGLETILWRGALGIEFNVFQEKRSNILSTRNVSVSNVFGFPGLPDENIGEIHNRGYELTLSHKKNFGELSVVARANVAFARSKVIFMDEVPNQEERMNQTGRPVGAGLFYQADGIFRTQEELDSHPHLPNAQVGDLRFVDLNGDGVIDGNDRFRNNFTNIPEYVFGLNFDFQYRNFDLNVFFQGQTNAINYDDRFAVLGNSAFDNSTVARATDRWTIDNPNGSMPRADALEPGANTQWLFDATFVRLKNVELGYSLPTNLISRIGLTDTRVFISGFNLLTWSKEIKWADPEANGGFLFYPQLRLMNLGVNVKF
ncbi:TonB-dependent receptor [Belliella sp. DSM 111904]|uniref:TonB-dependent receptor n=1 Tax=Belliella filtrata TaxID=2923435 RepID=A0ABS9V3S3_9BACT|nr:TonB-dependent receptor [Belliella filtrata]MCH7411062.1 TonB-dependent receptor [Belliella filtrata]